MRTRIVRWGTIALTWALIASIQTTFLFEMRAYFGKPVSWLQAARQPFVAYFLMWGVISTPIVIALCDWFPIEKRNWLRRFFLHLVFSVVLALCISLGRLPLHHFVYPSSDEPMGWMMLRSYFLSNGFDDISMYWAVAFICFAWMYYRRYNERELQTATLEAQLARSQLEALKMQIQPHFLFNTLHSISELMHQDINAADRVISRLSELLRLTLEKTGVQEVTLKAEIDFLEGYLEIERMRFGERLTVIMDLAPETLDALVPNMILQPLAENSIRHGIARRAGPGTVLVRCMKKHETLEILLRDDGPGRHSRLPATTNLGVGLDNTRKRLKQMYGNGQTLITRQPDAGGFEVQITIPFHVDPKSVTESEKMVTFLEPARPMQ